MAMDGDVLGVAVANVLINKSTIPPTPDMVTNIQQFWKDVCNEHVNTYRIMRKYPPESP
jgi:hypothetical protein